MTPLEHAYFTSPIFKSTPSPLDSLEDLLTQAKEIIKKYK